MTPGEITAVGGSIAAIIAAFYGGGVLKERKINGSGDTENQKVGVKECAAVQEKFIVITDNLANGQADIKKESRDGLDKLEDSIIKLTDEARKGRDKIYKQIQGLTEKVYKQGV